MKLSHLNFSRLYATTCPANLIRITGARDSALRRRWNEAGLKELFLVGSARHLFPGVADPFDKLLAELTGEPVRMLLRIAAKKGNPWIIPGAGLIFSRVELATYRSQGWAADKYMKVKATLLQLHCEDAGVPVRLVNRLDHILVTVDTDDMGLAMLHYKPGLPLDEIVRLCWAAGLQPRVFYWWLPYDFERRRNLDYFGKRLNPATSPANTPDCIEHARTHGYYLS